MESTLTFSITCGVDGSEYTPSVLTHLFDTAARHGLADCHVITVVPDHRAGIFRDVPTPAQCDAERAHAQATLVKALAQAFDELQIPRAQRERTWIHVRRGDAAEKIVELAGEAGA